VLEGGAGMVPKKTGQTGCVPLESQNKIDGPVIANKPLM